MGSSWSVVWLSPPVWWPVASLVPRSWSRCSNGSSVVCDPVTVPLPNSHRSVTAGFLSGFERALEKERVTHADGRVDFEHPGVHGRVFSFGSHAGSGPGDGQSREGCRCEDGPAHPVHRPHFLGEIARHLDSAGREAGRQRSGRVWPGECEGHRSLSSTVLWAGGRRQVHVALRGALFGREGVHERRVCEWVQR